jgi:hypothetical protein
VAWWASFFLHYCKVHAMAIDAEFFAGATLARTVCRVWARLQVSKVPACVVIVMFRTYASRAWLRVWRGNTTVMSASPRRTQQARRNCSCTHQAWSS